MASPSYPVYEGDGGHNAPRRPTAWVDLGGLDRTDATNPPPVDRQELASTDVMQATMSLERIARMAPNLVAELTLVTGAPHAAASVACVNDMIIPADVVVTNTATGKYRINYPPSRLPVSNCSPYANIIDSGGLIGSVDTLNQTPTSVEIWTYDTTGTLSGLSVTVRLRVF